MIDVFERLAPAYGRIVRRLALDVWYNRADVNRFLEKAFGFKKRYERELLEFFRAKGYRFNRKRLAELSEHWFADQILVPRKILAATDLKKGKLADQVGDMDEAQRREVAELFRRKPEGRILPVVSFSRNLEARAVQIGEEEAFALGRELNHEAVSAQSDVYKWMTQHDARVRTTHRRLAGKLFSYVSPPTTVDEYGHVHTGNPGTDWGCRCWEEPARGKPLIGFTVKA